jgi:hypothetical protein
MFTKGQSGNPRGRPKVLRPGLRQSLDKLGARSLEEIVKVVVQKAVNGDLDASKLILDRLWPKRTGAPVVVNDVPGLMRADDLPAAVAAIAKATLGGHISPQEGAALTSLMDGWRHAHASESLEARITALEQMLAHPTRPHGFNGHDHAAV